MPDHYITDLQLSDIQMVMPGGGTNEDAKRTNINEYTLDVLDGRWPEFIGVGTLPATGIYIRHVNDLYSNNIQVKTVSKDKRPPVVFDDVPRYAVNEIYSEGIKLEKIVVIE